MKDLSGGRCKTSEGVRASDGDELALCGGELTIT